MKINRNAVTYLYLENAGGPNTLGRVDQLEDRYLGMVEAPSSNLGTSTIDDSVQIHLSQ